MELGAKFTTIIPHEMDQAQRVQLARKVYYDAHHLVFRGVSFGHFYHTVFTPATVLTKVMIYHPHDKIIGYSTFQVYQINENNTQYYIAMTEMCLTEAAYAHHIHPIDFFLKECAKFIFQHPLEKIVMVDTLISPIIYKKACQTTFQIYPVPYKKTPPSLLKLCLLAAKKFNWNFTCNGKIIIRKLYWKVRNDYLLRDSSIHPKKDYFSSTIPDFQCGKGLVIVAPVTFLNVTASIIKSGIYRFLHILFRQDHVYY